MVKPLEWEEIGPQLTRTSCPGGWLYRYSFPIGASITFVPDPELVPTAAEHAERMLDEALRPPREPVMVSHRG